MKKKLLALLLCIGLMSIFLLQAAQAADTVNIDIGSVSSGGIGYSLNSNKVTINTSGSYTITGTSTSNKIEVASGVTADITLNSVNIDVSSSSGCAINIIGAAVDLTLVGDNVLKSANNYAGLHISQGALTITEASTGTLTATGGNNGAGIGGGYTGTTGSITIKGGTVTATGTQGAGIGGGYYSDVTEIIITGGNVTANGGDSGAGIGSCGSKACGTILITGGTVHANGGSSAPGIGCGYNGSGGSITINGGDVFATGGFNGMGIGTYNGTVDVSIGGGTIKANGGDHSPGIGGGNTSSISDVSVGSVHITGGNITATGGKYAAGIGGKYGGYICNITIDNGTINATGGEYGAGIGGGSDCGKKGSIVINGGNITATGSRSGAGIGAGGGKDNKYSRCGDITITGGEITAAGGLYSAGIGGGGGEYSSECGTISITGADTVVNAKGDYSTDAYDIGSGHKFSYMTTINGGTLKADGGATVNLNQKGSNSSKEYTTCIIGGSGAGAEAGIYCYGQKVNGVIDMSAPGTGKLCGTGYTYSDSTVSIGRDGTYAVINSTTTNQLMVADNISANVTLRDVNIDVSGISNACAFDMTGATVNLTLVGDNLLNSGSGCAGLQVPNGSTLTILSASTGTLNVTGGENGAGIGGGNGGSGGTITINGGEVCATGGANGAGIGGGNGGNGGTVEVTGSDSITVTAIGGTESNGYDVGSGYANTSGGTLTVNGGVTLGLMRNGTNAATSYITCNIGGPAAGLSLGTYLNSHKKLSVNTFVTDHPDGADAFETVQFAMLVDGVSSILPEGEIVFKSNGVEIGRTSIMHVEGLDDDQGYAIISWTAQGGDHALMAEYVQNATADSYYMTDKGELDNFKIAKIAQVPLTIDDPGVKTYGNPSFVLSIRGGSGTGGYSYEVTGEAVSVADGAVTVEKAGQATITVTNVGDDNYLPATSSITITVNKAAPPAMVFPSASTITYEQELSDSVLTGGSGDGSFAWESPDIIPTVVNSGYNVTFTPNDTDNYDYTGFVLTQNVSIHVSKAMPVVTFPTVGEITYEQPLSASALTGGSGDGSFAWESPDTIPTVLNSGYRVVFTPEDTDNYLTVSQIIAVSVQKAEQAEPAVGGIPSSVTYGDSPFDLLGSGGSGTGSFSYAVTAGDAVSVSAGGTVTVLVAGTAQITATKAGDSNYLPVSVDVTIMVNKATPLPVVFPSAGALTYGQPLSASVLTGGSGDGSFAWESPDTVPTVINTDYGVIFTPNDTENYDYTGFVLTQNVSIRVNKAIPVVTFPTAEELTYGKPLSDSTLTGGSGDGSFTWASPNTIPTVVNSGYSVKFTPDDTDNYEVISQIVNISVQKAQQATLIIGGIPLTVTYGDSPFDLLGSGGSGTGAFSYSITSGDVVSVSARGTVTVRKAGTAQITATKAGDSNYLPVSTEVTITVDKAIHIVVFPAASSLTYGQPLSVSVLTGGSGDGSFSWESPATIPTVVNSGYRVVFTPSDTDNYLVIKQPVAIAVRKAAQAPLSVSGIPDILTFGDAPFELRVSGGSGTGSLSYAVASGTAVTVNTLGKVTITHGGTAAIKVTNPGDDNYLPVSRTVSLKVNKAEQTDALSFALPESIAYGDTPFQIIGSGGNGSGAFSYQVASGDDVWVDESGIVTVIRPGDAIITAIKASDNDYLSQEKQVEISVGKGTQSPLTIANIPQRITAGQAPFGLIVSGGSGTGALSYAVTSGRAFSVDSDGIVTILRPGTAVLTVTKAEDDYYHAATATVEINIEKVQSYVEETSSASPMPSATPSSTATPRPTSTATPRPTATDTSAAVTESPASVTLKPLSIQADERAGIFVVTLNIDDLPEGTVAIQLLSGEVIQIDTKQETFEISIIQAELNEAGELVIVVLDAENIPLGNYRIALTDEVWQQGRTENGVDFFSVLLWIAVGVLVVGIALSTLVMHKKRK